jgi:hypothetical protein
MKTSLKKLSLLFALTSAALLSACGGPQGGVSKEQVDAMMAERHAQALEEEHVEAAGFKFVRNGSDLYLYQDGQPASTLNLTAGQTHSIQVLFLDANGQIIDFSVHAPGEFNARVRSSNTNVVRYSSTSAFSGNLRAVGAGSAIVTVDLVHLDHPDYSASFNVRVTF